MPDRDHIRRNAKRGIGARTIRPLAVTALLLSATPAQAEENALELWFNPVVRKAIDARTTVEFDSAQRLRDGNADSTFFVRGWLFRKLGSGVTAGVAAERRWDGPVREVRLLQHLSYALGPVKMRSRLEQRFLSNAPQTSWRLRQRVGTSIPLGKSQWSGLVQAEGFFVLRAPQPEGPTGLTIVRTLVGVERKYGQADLTLGYLRQQSIRRNAPDRVGHAPFIGIAINL